MLPLFQDNFILGEATSSHFFRVTTSTQQLLFRDSYFFRTAAFFPFFRTVTFSQDLFFQNSFIFGAKLLQSRHFLKISSLRQLHFGTAILSGGTVQDKDIQKRANFSKQVLLHSIDFFRKDRFWKKLIFQKSNIPQYIPTFSGELPFQSGYFFKRRYLLQQLPFQKSYFFTTYFFRRVTISQLQFHSTVTLLIRQ